MGPKSPAKASEERQYEDGEAKEGPKATDEPDPKSNLLFAMAFNGPNKSAID